MNPMQSPNTGVGKKLSMQALQSEKTKDPEVYYACWQKPQWNKKRRKSFLTLSEAFNFCLEKQEGFYLTWIEDEDGNIV